MQINTKPELALQVVVSRSDAFLKSGDSLFVTHLAPGKRSIFVDGGLGRNLLIILDLNLALIQKVFCTTPNSDSNFLYQSFSFPEFPFPLIDPDISSQYFQHTH